MSNKTLNLVLVIVVLVLIAWMVERMNQMREAERCGREELSMKLHNTAVVAVRAEGLATQAMLRLNALPKS